MSGVMPQIKARVKRSRSLAIGARIAAERGRDLRRMTGRKENEMGATHWALSLEQSLDYIDEVFDDYLNYGGYSVADRDGLYVLVTPMGTVSFRYNYRINGRQETLVIGRYGADGITLAEARERLMAAKKSLSASISGVME